MDHLGMVFVELGLILVGVSALGMVARRFDMSAIPFYLLAGLAFGTGGIAPVSASDGFVDIAAEIAVAHSRAGRADHAAGARGDHARRGRHAQPRGQRRGRGLPRRHRDPGWLAERARAILGPQRDLFAAIFFVAFGLTTDLRQLVSQLPLALGLAGVGILGKLATGWYAAGRDGVRRAGRLRAGFALAPRGEFSIVIAGLAVMAGYREVGLIATAYVLVLAVLGPVLAKFSDGIGAAVMPRRS